ncbi:MAG: helix-turn-helix domain-containing protein [Rhodocyclaceae bacterium]
MNRLDSGQPPAHAPRGLLHTHDVDEHAACLEGWGQRYDQLSAGRFDGCFEEYWFGSVQIFRERANQAIHESGQPWHGSRTLAVPVAIDGAGWFCGELFDLDSIITLKGGDDLDFRTPRLHEILALTADAAALNDYALQVDHLDIETELQGRRIVPAAPAQVARLRDFLATVLASLRATPDLLRHPQMCRALEQAVFGAVVDTVRSPAAEPRATPSCRTRQLVVERAREYMREHIDEPISVADLCVELRVSRRTLQYSFQDVLDLNPVKFLRAMRLNGVRRDLKRADPSRDTVADIAAHWGFWHLSHFAADYKTMFDELPSDTLKRATRTHA